MKVLVVDPNNAGRDAFAGALHATRHTVEALGELDAAMRRVVDTSPDVVAFATPTTASAVDFAKRMKAARRGQGAPYLLLLTQSLAPEHLAAVFAAGVDDFIRLPAHPDEARARVEAAARGRRSTSAEARTTLRFESGVGGERIVHLASWHGLPTIVATEMAGMLAASTHIVPLPKLPAKGLNTARVVCSLPAESVIVTLAIGAATADLSRVSEELLGAVPDEGMRADVLREMANGAAGAFKRAALADGLSFTIGLPEVAPFDAASWAESRSSRAWCVTSGTPESRILFRAEVRAVGKTRVPASELREGMVLASDLVAASGALVAAGGTRITASNAERVAKFLGPKHLVEIAAA